MGQPNEITQWYDLEQQNDWFLKFIDFEQLSKYQFYGLEDLWVRERQISKAISDRNRELLYYIHVKWETIYIHW